MTGLQHEEIHAVDTNANPTGKGGLSDSYRIAWSENAAVLFISNLLGNVILYQVGRLGFTGFILQGVYWIMHKRFGSSMIQTG